MSFSEQDLEEFKVEALELLEMAEKSLLALDQNGDFRTSFDSVFRGFHNLKGAAGMMELTALQSHTHELENILMTFKDGVSIPSEYISLFFRGVDAARLLLDGQQVQFNFEVENKSQPLVVEQLQPAVEIKSVESSFDGLSDLAQELPESAVDEFITESEEIVERVSKSLQRIEAGELDKDLIDRLYRDFHSLKGNAYLFSFTKLGDIAHAMESSIEKVRNNTHIPSKALLNCLFKSLEVIEALVCKIKFKESDESLAPIVPILIKVLDQTSSRLERSIEIPVPEEVETVEVALEIQDVTPIHEVLNEVEHMTLDTTQNLSLQPKEKEVEAASSIRVPVSLLDNLMTLMGEMVLVRNQVLQYSNKTEDLEFLSMSKRLNVVTSEIQEEMMKTRMQPIGNVLAKFNRVVRDLSQDLNKKINLNIHGAETELDKSLLEAIKDPLTHIVRNSCDHGIETPDVRRQNGKNETGSITIKSYHEGGQVVIEVSDDGKGLNKDQLVKKALEKSLISSAQATQMSEKDIFNLIFAPGFSTAAKVTNVSGRGVGMDVVRTNIEKIGGTVDLSGMEGRGTQIKIKIPLTLAIVPALLVKCGTGTFAIPQVKLEELVRVDQNASSGKIETIHGAPVFRLRGNILPLVDLNKILKIDRKKTSSNDQPIVNIAVLNSDHCSFGVIIDEVLDTADIVVKPLNRLIKSLQVYSGATVLGDGSIALIFDVLGISKVSQLGQEKTRVNENDSSDQKERRVDEVQDFLLAKVNSPTKHALALIYVQRLEEFKASEVETSGHERVVRYRDVILPIVSANELLGYKATAEKDNLSVVVVEKGGKLYGIEVDEIIDTLSTLVQVTPPIRQQTGVFGNLNMKEELIVVLDPFDMISKAFPEDRIESEFEAQNVVDITDSKNLSRSHISSVESGRVLLVEDTAFFRNAIKSVLEKRGYEVIVANDGKEAMEILNKQSSLFDVIVSDIEMPRMNGFQMATAIRKHATFKNIPLIAVSSKADQNHMKEGYKSGFDIYLEKLKPAVLLSAISELRRKRKEVS